MKWRTRAEVAAALREHAVLVSSHEHAGSELMYHHDEARHVYQQSVAELMKLIDRLRAEDPGQPGREGTVAGALVLPMPYYRHFKPADTAVDPDSCSQVIRERNLALLDECAAYRERHGDQGSFPMAALLVDPFLDARDFAAHYVARRTEVFALKWHPPASDQPIERYVSAGYLDLAAEWDLPTVTHCSPEGRLGDLAEIAGTALPEVERLGIRMSIAHLGFLNPGLAGALSVPGVFADLGPWEAICERVVGAAEPADEDRRLAALMAEHSSRLMFSLDTPWHLQPWDDGRILGAPVAEAVDRIKAARALAGPDLGGLRDLLVGNALRFLFGTQPERGSA